MIGYVILTLAALVAVASFANAQLRQRERTAVKFVGRTVLKVGYVQFRVTHPELMTYADDSVRYAQWLAAHPGEDSTGGQC